MRATGEYRPSETYGSLKLLEEFGNDRWHYAERHFILSSETMPPDDSS